VPVKLPYFTQAAFPNPPSTAAAASPSLIKQRSPTEVRKFLQHFFRVFVSRECVQWEKSTEELSAAASTHSTSTPTLRWTCQHSSQVLVLLSSTAKYHQLIAAETCHHPRQRRYILKSLLYRLRCPLSESICLDLDNVQSREEFFSSQISWCHSR
jgi:hypothetical protein